MPMITTTTLPPNHGYQWQTTTGSNNTNEHTKKKSKQGLRICELPPTRPTKPDKHSCTENLPSEKENLWESTHYILYMHLHLCHFWTMESTSTKTHHQPPGRSHLPASQLLGVLGFLLSFVVLLMRKTQVFRTFFLLSLLWRLGWGCGEIKVGTLSSFFFQQTQKVAKKII